MENLEQRFVGQQFLQVRRGGLPGRDLHDVRRAVAGRKLHHAQPVAMRVETHGLGIDRNRAFVGREVGKIAAMQANGHCVTRLDRMPGRELPVLSE